MDFHTLYEAYKMAHSTTPRVTNGMSIWIVRDKETMKVTLSGFHSDSTTHNPADGMELLGTVKSWAVEATNDFNEDEYNSNPEQYIEEAAYFFAENEYNQTS